MPANYLPEPPEQTDPGPMVYPMGRIVAPDGRDRLFRLEASRPDLLAAGPVNKLPEFMVHMPPRVMDQGSRSSCVGHGVAAKLMGQPVPIGPHGSTRHRRTLPWVPNTLYEIAQDNDEWPGSERTSPVYYGTSVRAGFRVAQDAGLIESYHAVYDVETMIRFMLNRHAGGGVVLGLDWKDSMWDTDSDGFIHYEGITRGGHCVYAYCASRKRKAIRIQNSWSENWGDHGRAWFSFADMERAFADRADCYASVESASPYALGHRPEPVAP